MICRKISESKDLGFWLWGLGLVFKDLGFRVLG